MNLLVVEDESVVRESVERRLEALGHTVLCAENVDRAEALLRSKPEIDIVVADIWMPGRGGIDLLRLAKAIRPDVEVILITGRAEVETAVSAVDADAFAYLRKPFLADELAKTVQRAAEHITLGREREANARQLEQLVRQLRASEERYRTLVEGIDGAVLSTDEGLVIRSASSRCSAVLGWTPESLIGKSMDSLRPAEDAAAARARVASLPGSSGSARLESRVARPDGSVIPTIEMIAAVNTEGAPDLPRGLFWIIQSASLEQELRAQAELARDYLEAVRRSLSGGRAIIGQSRAVRDVLRLVQQVAPSDASVLICGESGTGKELVAESLHVNSPRSARPFVVVNCATLQESLLESELFGHRRGSFTGAVADKRGLAEIADGGTLFVDEVVEMSPAIQAKMLRVLERGQFRPVGGTADRTTNIRVIAATNRDLRTEVVAGRFREDLFYRLDVVRIEVPPLRDRKEDIPLIARHRLVHSAVTRRGPKELSADALDALMAYDWPGNIRELCNVIERAIILSGNSPTITVNHLVLAPGHTAGAVRPLRELEDSEMAKALALVGGNKTRAAAMLGITRQTLLSRLKRMQENERAGEGARIQ